MGAESITRTGPPGGVGMLSCDTEGRVSSNNCTLYQTWRDGARRGIVGLSI